MSWLSDAFNFVSAPVNGVEKLLKKSPLLAPVRAGLAPFDLTKDIVSGKNVFESTATRGIEGIANSSAYGNKLQTSIWDSKPGQKIFGETNVLSFGTEDRAQAVPRLLNQVSQGGGVQESGVKKYDELNASGRGAVAVATAAAVYFGGEAAGGGVSGFTSATTATAGVVKSKSAGGALGIIAKDVGGSGALGDYSGLFSGFETGLGDLHSALSDNVHSGPTVGINDPIGLSSGYAPGPEAPAQAGVNIAAALALGLVIFAGSKLLKGAHVH